MGVSAKNEEVDIVAGGGVSSDNEVKCEFSFSLLYLKGIIGEVKCGCP